MARASATAENAATNAITALCAYLSLHTADPGTTGASEVTGGPYARQALTWGASSAGTAATTNAPAVPIPASTTVTHFGTQSASTAGTYEVGGALSSSVATAGTAGTVTFAAGSLTLGTS
jgi:hypothetical protein